MSLTLVVALFATSCQDWLDVKPLNQTDASILFESENGFQEALSGVYTQMATAALYGTDMTFGAVDVLGQRWDDVDQYYDPYFSMMEYDFEALDVITTFDNIWQNQFTAIAQLNNILSYIDEKKDVFESEVNYNIIKGEAIALRAFLHFDVYRLFAPYGDAADGKKWIPYIDEFTYNITASSTNEEFIERVYEDIEEALELLKSDYIYTNQESDDVYYQNRHFHLNYYGVKGLEARIALYNGDNQRAYDAAKAVIAVQSETKFPFVTSADATASNKSLLDRTFSTEHLFSLNVRKLGDLIEGIFVDVYDDNRLITREQPEDIFEGFQEYRRQYFEVVDDISDMYTKYSTIGKNGQRIALIRISEMYYIAAETASSIPEAVGYLNTIRVNRGIPQDNNIPTTITSEVLRDEILKEYNKEFIGEGQMYFYHKRMNSASISTQAAPIKYVIPIPDIEIEYGYREKYYTEEDGE